MGYNPKSCKAEEFINHEEILESLEYAQKNKGNKELIEGILDKANRAKGLTHREAAVLLECDDEELTDRMFKLAEDLKKRFYGNRIVMFAPLYLSNYCVNGCVYCPYHAKNKTIARKKLTQDEIRREVIALQDMGHKRLALEAGEDPVNNPIEYILECINTIYSIKHKNGAIRRVNVNIAATTVENYRKLKEAGIGTYILFQETYNKDRYKVYHPKGMKSKFEWRVNGFDRMGQAGVHKIGMGVLIGLEDWRTDTTMMAIHLQYLRKHYWKTKYSVNFPRMRPSEGHFQPNVVMTDRQLAQLIFAYRIFDHDVDISISTRESPNFRNNITTLGVTSMSAGSKTEPGGYFTYPQALEQFAVSDERSPEEVEKAIKQQGYEVVWKDWDEIFDR